MEEEVKKICDDYQVNELLNEIVEARCQRNSLATSYDNSEFFCCLFEPIAESIPFIFDNCNELLYIVNEDLSRLKLYQEESESCIDQVQQVIDEEYAQFKQASNRAKHLKFDSTLHLDFVRAIKDQIALREDHVLELENAYLATQDDMQALKTQLIIKENQWNHLDEETKKVDSEIIGLRTELQQREYLKWIAEEENSKRLEEEALLKRMEEEKQRLAEVQAKQLAEDEAKTKQLAEDEARAKKQAEEAKTKKLANAEAKKAEMEAKKQLEEEAAKKLAEEKQRRQDAEQDKRRRSAETRKKNQKAAAERRAENLRAKKEADAAKKIEAEAKRLQAKKEAEAAKKLAEAEAKRLQAKKEADAAKKLAEAEAKRLQAKKEADEEAKLAKIKKAEQKRLAEEFEAEQKILTQEAIEETRSMERRKRPHSMEIVEKTITRSESKKKAENLEKKKKCSKKTNNKDGVKERPKKPSESEDEYQLLTDSTKLLSQKCVTPIWKRFSQDPKESSFTYPSPPKRRLTVGTTIDESNVSSSSKIFRHDNTFTPRSIASQKIPKFMCFPPPPSLLTDTLDKTVESDEEDPFFKEF